MGGKKLKVEFIENSGARMKKFKVQKESLTKKLKKLTTLCDVGACMLIYDPSHNQSSICPHGRPEQVRRLIESYRCKIAEVKSCGVSDYFAKEKRKVEAELLKLRKDKYPTWSKGFDSMNEAELRGLGDALHTKSEMIKSRINEMMRVRVRVREMHDRHQLEMMNNHYNYNNHHQFLMNPAIDSTATDFGSYMNTTSSSIPLPQMNNVVCYNDGHQNQIEKNYNYIYDEDEKNRMMLWDGDVGTSTTELVPYTNISFSAEDQTLLDSLMSDPLQRSSTLA